MSAGGVVVGRVGVPVSIWLGAVIGTSVVDDVGTCDGAVAFVGETAGIWVGAFVGTSGGDGVGANVSFSVDNEVGSPVGELVESSVCEGDSEGAFRGTVV